MNQDVVSHADLTHFATWGLVIFVAVFVTVTIWALTRSRKEIKAWSSLPFDEEPAGPQQGIAAHE